MPAPTKRGRPFGALSDPDRKHPNPPTKTASARVTPHVYAQIAAEAEAAGMTVNAFLGQHLARRWACKCDECVVARRKLRRLRRDRSASYVVSSSDA